MCAAEGACCSCTRPSDRGGTMSAVRSHPPPHWLGLGVVLMVGLGCRVTLRFSGFDSGTLATSGCTTDQDCPLPSLHCDPPSGECFPCVSDGNCSQASGRPRCDTSVHICVQCGVVCDCPTGWSCKSMRCVQTCQTEANCSAGGTFCEDGICAQCNDDHACPVSNVPYCASETHQCVACLSDQQCTRDAPRCNPTTGGCVACLTRIDCPAGDACDPGDWTCTVAGTTGTIHRDGGPG